MKHIVIIIFFGALIQGCGEHRSKVISHKTNHKVQTTTLSSAPMANASVRKQEHRNAKIRANGQSAMRNDSVTTGRAAPSIPANRKGLRAMTYNEAQYSDKKTTFPRTLEAQKLEKEKYNN